MDLTFAFAGINSTLACSRDETPMTRHETKQLRRSVADFLSLERNVMAASGAVFLVGLGEELWKKFLPKYLEAVGAATVEER
jgi:hypothetical protein